MNTIQDRKPMGFGKTMLASATGFVVAFVVLHVLGFFLMIGLVAALVASGGNSATVVAGDHIFLGIDLSHRITERTPDKVTALLNDSRATGLADLLRAIEHAKDDKRVDGIYLKCDASGMDWAQCEELRDALERYRSATGKPVMAYATQYSQSAYYLASTGDCVALHPSGIVDLRGISAEVIFYKDLLDKLGVRFDLIRPKSNDYKSAGETYTRSNMSEANREQIRSYIGSIWTHVAEGIAEGRRMSIDSVNLMADKLTGYLAADACSSRMVDTLMFERDIRTWLKEEHGCRRLVDAVKYARSFADEKIEDKIAVIYAEGNVVDGSNEGYATAVYADDIVEALADAAQDKKVKAIVLRINSPGGSATASESMTHAVTEAKRIKPVVVSMSGLAASAGYEIAAGATAIVAHPTTLTGSIGVFAAIPEAGALLKGKLGIGIDTVNTNRNAGGLSLTRPLSATARNAMQRQVEDFYTLFCQRVAEGRGMTAADVDRIGRGRVWTGLQAVEHGLVDTLGGMQLALRIAAEEAGIERYRTVDYPKEKDLVTRLLKVADEKEDIVLRSRIEAVVPYYNELIHWTTMAPIQARMPYCLMME
ncbi:MAG: protease IV [bacterium P3]|nr:MAG: protease IV [bacterium P3]KWW42112.1 MAG: protease IV [bacterium F083]